MLNIKRLFRNYEETGTLSEHCSLFSFIDDHCFLTKTGEVGVVLQLAGIDYECLDQRRIDTATKRLEAAMKVFGPDFSVYQYLFKSHFRPPPPASYNNPIVNRAEQERHKYFMSKADTLFSVDLFLIVLYQGQFAGTKMTLTKAIKSLFTQGLPIAADNFYACFGTSKTILLIEDDIEKARQLLVRAAKSFVTQLNDVVDISIAGKHEAFLMLRRLLNVDPTKVRQEQLKYDVLLDKFLVGSPIESYRDHLDIDGYYTRVLTLKEETSETWPLVLKALLEIDATYHVVTEWRSVDNAAALSHIETMRGHFHKTKKSLSTATGPSADVLSDENKQSFVVNLGTCMKEIGEKGNYFGKFTLSVIVYSKEKAFVEKAVDDFDRVFTSRGGSLYHETYNQLSAYFATQPGNSHFNFRRLWITNTNYADWSFLFCLHEGQPWNTFLDREPLALVETASATPFFLNLHQRIQSGDGAGTDDVAHTLITGRTGAGKSFCTNFLVVSFQKYDPYTFIFDVGGSYKKLTKLLKGVYFELGDTTRAFRINPFSLEPTTPNLDFLFAFFKVLIEGSDDYRLTNDDDRQLHRAIENIYSLDDTRIRRLQTLAATLPRTLADRLHKWVGDGQYGYLFDNEEDTLTFSHFQCFDLEGMTKQPQLVQPFLFYILHRASHIIHDPSIAGKLKIFLFDEAWLFFTVPAIKEYLVRAAKTWRKRNGILIMATQSPEDLKKADLLTVLDSLPTKLFLANPDADYKFYAETFRLNQQEIDLITGLVMKRQLLLKTATMTKKLTLNVDAKSYWLYTNSPHDNDRFEAAINKYGFDEGLDILARS